MTSKDETARKWCCGLKVQLYHERTLATNQGGDDDAIVTFRVVGFWTVYEWSHSMADIKIQDFLIYLQI
jgi:hypothetical protein